MTAVERAAELLRSLERTHGPDLDVMGVDSDVAAEALAAAGLLAEPTDQRETRTEWATGLTGDPRDIGPALPEERARLDVEAWNRTGWYGTAVLYRREVGPWVEVPS